MTPFFSIIIPTYNRWPLLREALESVFQQSFQDFEIIVVDDGSTDGTPVRLQNIDRRIRLFSCDRGGPACARNVGLQEARGEFVAFLDSDDRWMPGHLLAAKHVISRHPEVDFLFADTRLIRAAGIRDSYLQEKPIEKVPFKADGTWRIFRRVIYPELVQEMTLTTSSVIVRSSILTKIGRFDERLTPFGEDTDLWLRVCATSSAAGNWCVTVERRKFGDNLVNSGQDYQLWSKEIELFLLHTKGAGNAYRAVIRERLARAYWSRLRAGMREHIYSTVLVDVGRAAWHDPSRILPELGLVSVSVARRILRILPA